MAKKEQEVNTGLLTLKADIKQGAYRRIYIFYGEEAYLKDYYLSALKKRLLDGAAEEFNYRRLTDENMSLDALYDAMEALPMMAEYTLVQVDDYNPFDLNEAERDTFCELISDVPETCCLVFNFDAAPYKKDGRMQKLSAAIKKYCMEVEFRKQTPGELSDWISRHFRGEGKTISPDLCQYLLFITDGTMTTLDTEIRKIASYCAGQNVTRQDIDDVVEPALNAVLFNITDAIAENDYDKALKKLDELVRGREEPIPILAAIGTHFRRLLIAKTVLGEGKGAETLSSFVNSKNDYYAKLLLTQARKVSDEFCRKAILRCYETDKKMKRSYADNAELLQVLLMEFATEARK